MPTTKQLLIAAYMDYDIQSKQRSRIELNFNIERKRREKAEAIAQQLADALEGMLIFPNQPNRNKSLETLIQWEKAKGGVHGLNREGKS